MNSDASNESAVQKFHFMDEGAGGNRPPHFEKLIQCSGKTNFTPPFFWGIKFKKKNLFL
jgi:hypothetical protein